MRDSLIELINEFKELDCCTPPNWWIEHFADHLLANGVIVPPVSVGQKVYIIDEGDEGTEPYVLDVTVTAIGYDIGGFWITMNLPLGLKQSARVGELSFGKTVFLTREEATGVEGV